MSESPLAVVRSSRHETPVFLSRGITGSAESESLLPDADRPLAIVTDGNVDRCIADRFARAAMTCGRRVLSKIVIPPGEASKSYRDLERLHREFASAGLGRDGFVLAIGGGVVCDLAGYAAAGWNRGVDWVAMPTSLVAQIDAAIGGKTGIDLDSGKNLVGAFWPPVSVIVDPSALASLPSREFGNGRGELLKYALLEGERRLEQFRELDDAAFATSSAPAIEAIERAITIKAELCSKDEFDRGERRVLNAGHTIGHALETADGYRTLAHGEAVAIGLIAEAKLAADLAGGDVDLASRISDLCRGANLPERARGDRAFRTRALAALALDKKRSGQGLVFALPCAPGNVRIVALDPVRDRLAIERALDSAIEIVESN